MKGFLGFYQDSMKDMLQLSGLKSLVGRALFILLSAFPILIFVVLIKRFDRRIAQEGLSKASQILLRKFYQGVESHGGCKSDGGLLLLCHHPGIADSLALFGTLGREDLVALVNDRYFFRAFKSMENKFIFVDQQNPGLGVLRDMLAVLREGKVLILYPGGGIETDPALVPEGENFLLNWSTSPLLLQKLANREGWSFSVQSTIVSGIFSPVDLEVPWVRRGRTQREKESRAILPILFASLARKRKLHIHYSNPEDSSSSLGDKSLFPEIYQEKLIRWYWESSAAKLR